MKKKPAKKKRPVWILREVGNRTVRVITLEKTKDKA